LDGADIAQVAAHGGYGYNWLLSALQPADGPLMLYDLQRRSDTRLLVLFPASQSGVCPEPATKWPDS
jgi:hypothetical protein